MYKIAKVIQIFYLWSRALINMSKSPCKITIATSILALWTIQVSIMFCFARAGISKLEAWGNSRIQRGNLWHDSASSSLLAYVFLLANFAFASVVIPRLPTSSVTYPSLTDGH